MKDSKLPIPITPITIINPISSPEIATIVNMMSVAIIVKMIPHPKKVKVFLYRLKNVGSLSNL